MSLLTDITDTGAYKIISGNMGIHTVFISQRTTKYDLYAKDSLRLKQTNNKHHNIPNWTYYTANNKVLQLFHPLLAHKQ